MKKKLEADLMSIAHRVLQMKNKSDINQLCIETRKLYEKLAVLQFVEEHFEGVKPTIGQAEVVAKMKQFFEENHLSEVKSAITKIEIVAENGIEAEFVAEEFVNKEAEADEMPEVSEADFNEIEPDEEGEGEPEEVAMPVEEPVKVDDLGFQPAFQLDVEEETIIEIPTKAEAVQISFEDFLGSDYTNTLFVKLDEEQNIATHNLDFELPKVNSTKEAFDKVISEDTEAKTVSLNDKLSKGISIDLNDRIAFVKHLFGNSDEDYNRVLNQLITYDNFDEAYNFIEDMVKPDYNSWEGKEDYEQRFIEIIEKKFA